MMRFLLIFLILAFNAKADTKVVDGDSLEIDDKEIRLIGIDSPEYNQTCYDLNNEEYDCGKEAYMFLKILVENGLNQHLRLKCNKKGVDKYKRDLSECFIGKTNINEEMVKSGYAIVYRHDTYKKYEDDAKEAKRGIWQGRFMRPELYRILQKYQKEEKNI